MTALFRLLFTLWIGAVACVSFVVTRAVFGTIEARELAGDVMAPIFKTVDLYGVAVSLLFALVAWPRKWRAGLALLLACLAAANAFVLSPKIAARAEGYMAWHQVSTGFWIAILAGGIVLCLRGPR